jgi:hypothetical protein
MSAYRRLGVSEASRFCFQRRSRRSPFTVHRSPFTVHRSPFTVHRSPFTVHRSPFTVHRLAFTVHRSAFADTPTRPHALSAVHRSPPFLLSPTRPYADTPTRPHADTRFPPCYDDRRYAKSPDDHGSIDLFTQNPVSSEDRQERQQQLHLAHPGNTSQCETPVIKEKADELTD